MSLPHDVAALAGVITVGFVFSAFAAILGWVERRTGAPIMREKINAGSDRFFEEDKKNWGRSEIDSILRFRFDEV